MPQQEQAIHRMQPNGAKSRRLIVISGMPGTQPSALSEHIQNGQEGRFNEVDLLDTAARLLGKTSGDISLYGSDIYEVEGRYSSDQLGRDTQAKPTILLDMARPIYKFYGVADMVHAVVRLEPKHVVGLYAKDPSDLISWAGNYPSKSTVDIIAAQQDVMRMTLRAAADISHAGLTEIFLRSNTRGIPTPYDMSRVRTIVNSYFPPPETIPQR